MDEAVKFVLGFAVGVFLTLSLARLPHYVRFDDQPETPLDWSPKMKQYRNGKEVWHA